ncbi:UEV domain-containing protein [Histomonas meleagridis]|uniref:UEV domain-containing protein n=1 Tax=Histomonas meleagridis TaxID=135588 RepID=UPI003559A42E|nr:UEV domain-containing protein [Histomonas meleagridis]KAH0798993.1 UEV domain-containing protein [Histomonas meleagridis]
MKDCKTKNANKISNIIVSGEIPLTYLTSDIHYLCPVMFYLPDKFPSCPPVLQVLAKPIRCSKHLNTKGTLDFNGLYTWNQNTSTLIEILDVAIRYLSNFPPINPDKLAEMPKCDPSNPQPYNRPEPVNPSPQQNNANYLRALTQQSAQEIAMVNSQIVNSFKNVIDYNLYLTADMTAENVKVEASTLISNLTTQIEQGDIPSYEVPHWTMQIANLKAEHQTFKDVIETLRGLYRKNKITLQEFISKTREISRKHFKEVIYPEIAL